VDPYPEARRMVVAQEVDQACLKDFGDVEVTVAGLDAATILLMHRR
jgi:hypothetical protein